MLQGIGYGSDIYSAYNRIQQRQYYNSDENLKSSAKTEDNSTKAAAGVQQQDGDMDLRLDDIKPRKNSSVEEISLSIDNNASFSMKGRDSDIASLDMEKAVSDMQKDQALMQYQYFVGDNSPFISNEDGTVIAK